MRRIAPVTLAAFALTSVAGVADTAVGFQDDTLDHPSTAVLVGDVDPRLLPPPPERTHLLNAAAQSFGPGTVLHDNGVSFLNGMSNQGGAYPRRSILDDFTIAPPELWLLQHFWIKGAAADGSGGGVELVEITFYGDANGAPDFNDPVAVAQNTSLTQMNDPDDPDFFNLDVWDLFIDFDPVVLPPGTYWVDMNIEMENGDLNWFQVIGDYPQQHGESVWVDYEDFGGRQRGFGVFGDHYDANFVIRGELVGEPFEVSTFNVQFGRYVSGTVFDLHESDDQRLVIEQRAAVTPRLPSVRVEIIGESPIESPSFLAFVLESSATAIPPTLPRTIELFNHAANQYETVETGRATLDDSYVAVTIDQNPGRFVRPGTGQVRTRLSWFDPGGLFFAAWRARIDQAFWGVVP